MDYLVYRPRKSTNSRSWTLRTVSPPDVQADVADLDFGTGAVNGSSAVRTLILGNAGQTSLTLTQIKLTGTHAADFRIVGSNPRCTSLLTPLSRSTQLQFAPHAAGNRTARLHIVSTDPVKPVGDIQLTGLGYGYISAQGEWVKTQ